MIGKNLLWLAKQLGHSVQTMVPRAVTRLSLEEPQKGHK
jgi:hypothetical protein